MGTARISAAEAYGNSGLPLSYRQVVTLYLEEMSYAEIAEALDISESNVGVRISRAKQMLKEMLS